jgi:hypothetical protein
MTADDFEAHVHRLSLWWAAGLGPWRKPELFVEFAAKSNELMGQAVQSFVDEGRDNAPSPSTLLHRMRELAPVELVAPGDCRHDRAPYPWSFETPSAGSQVVVVTCRFCGAQQRRGVSQLRTPGEDREQNYEQRVAVD